jgi:nicotinamide riboside kinase
MRIGLCGTVSVGKTTLVNELKKLEQFKDYETFTERSKYLRDLGIPLNTDSTIRGQFVFLAERSMELMRTNMITDRTVWDVCSFTIAAKTIPWEQKQKFVESAQSLMNYYDLVIYVSPDGVPIEDNGVRTIEPKYREQIDKVIIEMLDEFKPNKLIKVKGTTEERINIILSHI